MKLSVTIITLNEEKDLPRSLDSVKQLADEIVVVDSGSSDKTVEIAKNFGAKVYVRKFDNYSNQKKFAADKTSGEWILSLDADEIVSKELADEIKTAINNETAIAYSMPRRNIILGKFIKYSRWQPEFDRHIWLWKKNFGKWEGQVHEELVAKGKIGKLKNPKVHYQYETVREFLDMMNKYSNLDSNKNFSLFRFFFDPLYNFLVRYFYRLGFLDGWRGFVLSYLMGIYHLEVWVKAWEKQK